MFQQQSIWNFYYRFPPKCRNSQEKLLKLSGRIRKMKTSRMQITIIKSQSWGQSQINFERYNQYHNKLFHRVKYLAYISLFTIIWFIVDTIKYSSSLHSSRIQRGRALKISKMNEVVYQPILIHHNIYQCYHNLFGINLLQ